MTSTPNKHVWTRDEIVLVTRCYLENKSIAEIHAIMPELKISSIKLKYVNCLYLDKGTKNVSKMHTDVWEEIRSAQAIPDVETESTIEFSSTTNEVQTDDDDDEPEEDGETYFKCTGACNRVLHYEDSNQMGMCGRCEYEDLKKGRKIC